MTTFITIIYVIVATIMVLSILLQSGKGGGLGSALGGGASQTVFGSGGGADFMGKLTQGFAATFMISAMYLAYASAHAGSSFLEEEDKGTAGLAEDGAEIDYEYLPGALKLPTAEEAQARQAAASVTVPAQTDVPPGDLDIPTEDPAPVEAPEPAEPSEAIDDPTPEAPEGAANEGTTPDDDSPDNDTPEDDSASKPADDSGHSPTG